MKAVCDIGDIEKHLRKGTDSCGLYSYKSPDILLRENKELIHHPTTLLAAGVVFNYGVISEYSEGFRSSHCLIDTIFLPEFICYRCYYVREEERKAEFIQASLSPGETIILDWNLDLLCLDHYHLLRRLGIFGWKNFPIEAVKIDLERYYQVPVRDLRELIGGRQ